MIRGSAQEVVPRQGAAVGGGDRSCQLRAEREVQLLCLATTELEEAREVVPRSCRDGRYRPSGAAASAQSPRPRFALAFGLRYAPTAELSVYLST